MGHQSWIQKNFMRTGYGLIAAFSLLVWMNDQSPEAVEQREEIRGMLQRGWNWAQTHFNSGAAPRRK